MATFTVEITGESITITSDIKLAKEFFDIKNFFSSWLKVYFENAVNGYFMRSDTELIYIYTFETTKSYWLIIGDTKKAIEKFKKETHILSEDFKLVHEGSVNDTHVLNYNVKVPKSTDNVPKSTGTYQYKL